MKFLGQIVIPAVTPWTLNLGDGSGPFTDGDLLTISADGGEQIVDISAVTDAATLKTAIDAALVSLGVNADITTADGTGSVILTGNAPLTVESTNVALAKLNLAGQTLPLEKDPTPHSVSNLSTADVFSLGGWKKARIKIEGGGADGLAVAVGAGAAAQATESDYVHAKASGALDLALPNVPEPAVALINLSSSDTTVSVYGLFG